MTLHERDLRRKPRRGWLWFPWLLALAVAGGWSGYWFWLKNEAAVRMDAGAQALRAAGYEVAWQNRTISGFPFRLDINVTEARIAEPSGWALAFPSLKTEAYAYRLDHWVAVAPQGAVMTRPYGGPVAIRGQALRASLAGLDQRPPRISVEGHGLTFTPGPGARPFMLQSAERLELHLRPGPDDQGAVLLKVDGARARLPGLLQRIAEDRPVAITWDMVLSKMSGLRGSDWRSSARNWSTAGGTATVRQATLQAGPAVLVAKSGALTVGPDGRVQGSLDVDLRQAKDALNAMSGGLIPSGFGFAQATLTFAGGQTVLGPLPIAPAPRVY